MSENLALYFNLIILLVLILLLVWLLDLIIWKVLRTLSVRIARKSNTDFDDFLVRHRMPRFVAHIFPLILLFEFVPIAFIDFDYGEVIVLKILLT
jgi:miniconductance mechanosensitive channel